MKPTNPFNPLPVELHVGYTSAPECRACGIPFTDHLGIQGTCAKLQAILRFVQLVKKSKVVSKEEKKLARLIEMMISDSKR